MSATDDDRADAVPRRWPSLTTPGMAPVWEAVRARLERRGLDARGSVALPEVGAEARVALRALLQRAPTARLDLGRLEEGLVRAEVGPDLPSALARLGFAPSSEPARRRAEQAAGRHARDAARAEAAAWPEPWAEEWVDGVVRAGVLRRLSVDEAVGVVVACRRVLDAIDAHRGSTLGAPLSRVQLAARVLGDAHALDTGSRVEAAVSRALALQAGPVDGRTLWEAAGVDLDLTSGPVLTWNLRVAEGSSPAGIIEPAAALGVPVHLSRMLLVAHPVTPVPGSEVLVVENPRIAEAAAQARSPRSVVSAGGAPSGAVQLLVRQLVDGGADVRYHGDFDAAGLLLCARMAAVGVAPWRMTADDYLAALAAADADGVDLPRDDASPPPTPWDPELHDAFAAERRIVHEERLLPGLLDP